MDISTRRKAEPLMDRTPIEIVPFDAPVGAEVKGIDIARGVDDLGYARVRDALDKHSVVVLREQQVSPENQRAFASGMAHFGRWSTGGIRYLAVRK